MAFSKCPGRLFFHLFVMFFVVWGGRSQNLQVCCRGGVSLRVLLVGRDCGCVGQCGCRVSPKKGCKIKQRKNNWYLSMLFGVYAGLLFLLAISGRGSEPMEVGLWAKPFIFIIKGLWQNTEVSRTSFLEVITKCLENWERSQGSEWSCLSCGLLPALQDLFSFFFLNQDRLMELMDLIQLCKLYFTWIGLRESSVWA